MRALTGFCIFICYIFVESTPEGYTITPINTSSGLYYEKIGDVLLSNGNWEFVTSVDYAGYLLFHQYLHQQAENLQQFCREYQSENCDKRFSIIKTRLNTIDETDENMAGFLGIKKPHRRVKRFWKEIGDFFRGVGKAIVHGAQLIFGEGDSRLDLSIYDRQIGNLQSGQRELENKVNQQTTIFMVDAERKALQIQWLKKTQGEIKDKIFSLHSDFKKDSEEKAKQINELKEMLDETNEKLKIQEEVQNKVVTAVEEIQEKLLNIDGELKNIRKNIDENKERVSQLELNVKLNSLSINFDFLMDQFEMEQQKLFGVIKNAKRGHLDPYILTSLNLIQMLQDILPSLSEGHQFPFYPNIENAANLYNVIKPNVYLYNNKIIFIMKIPLVDYRRFNIHKMTSLPVAVDSKKFAYILPQEPFLLIDNSYENYMLMSFDDFRNFCNEVISGRYLCKQVQQLSKVHSSKDCEIELFASSRISSKTCDKRVVELEQPMFLQLQQERSWIYLFPELRAMIISCGSRRNSLGLEKTGFISLGVGCQARTSDFMLISLEEFTKPVLSNYSAPGDLTDFVDLSNIENWNKEKRSHEYNISPFDLDHLNEISLKLIDADINLTWLLVSTILTALLIAVIVYINRNRISAWISRIRERYQHHHSRENNDSSKDEEDRLKLKVKLNRKDEKITNVSVEEKPSSTDPEAEYLTVMFKVKKDKNTLATSCREKQTDDKLISKETNVASTSAHDIEFLNELRKIKPNIMK